MALRDELARALYAVEPNTPIALTAAERLAGASEWDCDHVQTADVIDCYERADALLATIRNSPGPHLPD